MIFIKYPQSSLDNDPDLLTWHATATNKRNWGKLKNYLFRHLWEPYTKTDENPKCWYSEMPITDHFAQDVEHFRPKMSAVPLNAKQKKKIEAEIGYPVPESPISHHYAWLEFNHLNYRAVTALTNRGGGKVDSFPVLIGTSRLTDPQLPSNTTEYSLLLDPCIEHDANVLMVLPTGEIVPKAEKRQVTTIQLADPARHWHDDEFNYLRGWTSIVVYQLDYSFLLRGRKKTFSDVKQYMERLERDITFNLAENIKDHLTDIKKHISMYATYSLAARCAVLSYDPKSAANENAGLITQSLLQKLLTETLKYERSLA
jgi:hypothetical protein